MVVIVEQSGQLQACGKSVQPAHQTCDQLVSDHTMKPRACPGGFCCFGFLVVDVALGFCSLRAAFTPCLRWNAQAREADALRIERTLVQLKSSRSHRQKYIQLKGTYSILST